MTHGNKESEEKKGKVLIVDDERMICDTLGLILSRKGININTALSGQDAIRQIKKNDYNLIILDFSLPDIDGLNVLTQLKHIKPDTPVIFMTGYGSETVSIKAFKLGVSDYFIKPFNPKELGDRVLQIVRSEVTNQTNNTAIALPFKIDKDIETSSGIGRAVQHLKDNYKTRISLEEISNIAGLSRYHFTRAFKKVMGIPFSDYLSHLRVKKSEDTLASLEVNISEVAFSVGFNSLRQFERAFKKTIGLSPLEYRKKKNPPNPPPPSKKTRKKPKKV
ncbi:MAG: response regulator transcription factor [Proteobacteria bacterium]|nr:response regulator transcription factor [Pseudomonadota bacterium]